MKYIKISSFRQNQHFKKVDIVVEKEGFYEENSEGFNL
ncbi:hypothetical protein J2S07_003753 [Robertmurraya andreesenii]|uniref:Uncharacterized protein n=1 Tax=Anoxybacillus andreesenii TaxID=1325932 RepID=A0ABT9V8Y0_9BACL|nr:hypothetical protein [Robertmurraya andreesenii]